MVSSIRASQNIIRDWPIFAFRLPLGQVYVRECTSYAHLTVVLSLLPSTKIFPWELDTAVSYFYIISVRCSDVACIMCIVERDIPFPQLSVSMQFHNTQYITTFRKILTKQLWRLALLIDRFLHLAQQLILYDRKYGKQRAHRALWLAKYEIQRAS